MQAKLSQANLDNQKPLNGLGAARNLAWDLPLSGWLTSSLEELFLRAPWRTGVNKEIRRLTSLAGLHKREESNPFTLPAPTTPPLPKTLFLTLFLQSPTPKEYLLSVGHSQSQLCIPRA